MISNRYNSEQVFDELFAQYYNYTFATAYLILKDRNEAEDLVQTFFTDLWTKGAYVGLRGDIRGYLYRSIKNRALNFIRDQSVKNLSIVYNEAISDQNSVLEPQMDDPYLQVEAEMTNLPRQQKTAVELVYLEAMSYKEAALTMGISINSLKSHLKVGIKKIRLKLKATL